MKKIVISMVCLFLCSCVSLHKAGNYQVDPGPIRNIEIVVYKGGWVSESSIRNLIQETSEQWLEQFGIKFSIKTIIPISWEHYVSGYPEVVRQMLNPARESGLLDKDTIVVGFYRMQPHEYLLTGLYGWVACIDDRWRRFIVMKEFDDVIFSHELIHAFLYGHSGNLLSIMAPMQFPLVPYTPLVLRGVFITDDVYETVMENKWRSFDDVVDESVTEEVLGL